jgi:dihydrolipoamide dehydrogenase
LAQKEVFGEQEMSQFDVVVVGGGPGGYAAAIRCAQKGASVALIEKNRIGGTCLNVGCIPSKTLLASAQLLLQARDADKMGLTLQGEILPDWPKMVERKDMVVDHFVKGLAALVEKNGITIYCGKGIVTSPEHVRIDGEGTVEIQGKKIILATGSGPIGLPQVPFDNQIIISSTEALSLPAIPESLVIIGGGVIGCEMASLYGAVGTKVTILEQKPHLLPIEDDWVGKLLEREFKKLGITSKTGCTVTGVEMGADGATVLSDDGQSFEGQKVLVAVGRKVVCDPETVESLNLKMNGPIIVVNDHLQSSAENVYAIGDVIGTTYLAHGAFAEAEVAAVNATGGAKTMTEADYDLIPHAIYSFPEVASIGLNERQCAQRGVDVVVGKAPFRSNGRSVSHNEIVGEVRVLCNKGDDRIVGVTIVGAVATEMLSAARALIGSTEKIEDICFAHPTVSEVLKDAWEDAYGISLHVLPH